MQMEYKGQQRKSARGARRESFEDSMVLTKEIQRKCKGSAKENKGNRRAKRAEKDLRVYDFNDLMK